MGYNVLPQFIVIKSLASKRNAYYMNETKDVRGYVRCAEESVFNPFAKIEVEASKFNPKYVHLRFPHSNKYWGRSPTNRWIVASSNQPVEELSKSSCTLFEPSFGNGGQYLYLTHVQSGRRVRVDDTQWWSYIYVDDKSSGSSSMYTFTFVDWDTLVKLPKYVTFKGDNGAYLRAYWCDGSLFSNNYPYLQFSGDDFNHEHAAHEVFLQSDGHIRIKSVRWNKFWRRSPNWIWGDSCDASGNDVDTLFWPVKLDDKTIALRNAGNNYFCRRLTTEGKINCLNAGTPTIITEAKLVVEELVLERSIYNVRYRMEDARIYGETPFVVGKGDATNNSDTESTLAVKVAYTDTCSYTFTYTLSVMLGVKTTIETGFPKIVDGRIEVSATITNTFAWGKTTQTSQTSEATYTCKVPPKSRVKVNYVGTQGKCSVPFSYTQRDKRSSDGNYVTNQQVDGIFHGINYYSYHFEQLPFEAI